MVFSSLVFTFFFLPCVVGIYYLVENKYKNMVLLMASLVFYGYGKIEYVFLLLMSILINYYIAKAISNKNKYLLYIGVALNLSVLFLFKYYVFVVSEMNKRCNLKFEIKNVGLPIGISFFTFQAISYLVDVYYKKVSVQENIVDLALYISFFPQLVAGPIVRYSCLENQLENRIHSLDKFSIGFKRFMLGFCKKVIIANNVAIVASEVFSSNYKQTSIWVLWIGAISYSLQIYYDFSGYSDMAIGLAKMFGFDFEENFNYPYISKSVTEFWRRWHISLGTWFRDYVYIPLGGSSVTKYRHLLNMFVVWFITGIWHGANYTFIIWGMWYFLLLVIEKYIIKPEEKESRIFNIFWWLITLICIILGWVMFNSANIKNGFVYCASMFGCYGNKLSINGYIMRVFREYGFFFICGIVFSTPIMKFISKIIKESKLKVLFEILTPMIYAILFLWAVSFIILGSHNPFIYFSF